MDKIHKQLLESAKNPFDLNQSLDSSRILSYVSKAAHINLGYAFERINKQTLSLLEQLAKSSNSLEQYTAMTKGSIVNRTEQRPALHTLLRSFNQNLPVELNDYASNLKGQIEKEHIKLQNYLKKIKTKKQFSDVIVIGIGGSELGPKAILESLRFYNSNTLNFHFLSNIDTDSLSLLLSKLDLSTTLVITISKSGSTLETSLLEEHVRDAFVKSKISPFDHFIAITTPNSKLDRKDAFHDIFYLDESIGGRFSTTSMVGLVILGLALGYSSCIEFLEGAYAMDCACFNNSLDSNPALLSALLNIWNHSYLKIPARAVLAYSDALQYLPAHLQQLIMESNGKPQASPNYSNSCPVILGGVGTNIQHSFFQHIHQSPQVTSCEFICISQSSSFSEFNCAIHTQQQINALAQALALAKGSYSEDSNSNFNGNRPSQLILLSKITPTTMGALLSFYENRTLFEGFIYGINSFDQEGVQLGKNLAKSLSKAQKESSKTSVESSLLKLAGIA